jgi:uncharacterized protein YjiS (DUF1127 family)
MYGATIAGARFAGSTLWLMLARQCHRFPPTQYLKLRGNFIGKAIAAVSRRLVLNRTLAHLQALDDYLLRDIGLTRADTEDYKNYHL